MGPEIPSAVIDSVPSPTPLESPVENALPPLPQQDQAPTPPPFPFPNSHNEEYFPLPSPTSYPRMALNTPQTLPLQLLDLDVPMAPPSIEAVPPPPPSQNLRTPPTPLATQPTLMNNALGLNAQANAPPQPTTKSRVLACLEEVANDLAADGGYSPHQAAERFTLGPMPQVQDTSPTSIFNNIDLTLVAEWESHPGNKLLAVPFDPDAKSQANHEVICTKILTAVTEILGVEGTSVTAPRPYGKLTNKSRIPTTFIIYNITKDQANLLLEWMV